MCEMPPHLSAGVNTMAVTSSLDVIFERAIPTLGAVAMNHCSLWLMSVVNR